MTGPRPGHTLMVVRIEATPGAIEYVRSRGGVLYVWVVTMEYGYHPVFVLEASIDPPGPERDFQRFESEDIVLLLDLSSSARVALLRPPVP